jgi:hypothetical protein
MIKSVLVQSQLLTQNRSNTSECLKRSSTRSKNSNRTNNLQIVVVAAQGAIQVDEGIEDEAVAEEAEDVDEGEEDNEAWKLCLYEAKTAEGPCETRTT